MSTSSINILVLEDDPDMRDLLAMALADEGYSVEQAGRGVEALELARNQAFDLVVADIRMEGMDGLDVIQRVRQQSPETRSLVVTGYSTEADSIRAIRLGVGDYLKKPFQLDDFLQSVNRLVADRRRELKQQEPEQAMRRTALWALRALSPATAETGRLAATLAMELGLSEASAEEAELAVLVALLRSRPEGALLQTMPLAGSVEKVLAHLGDRWDSGQASPVESRVAAVALAAGELLGSEDAKSDLALELSRQHPGRFEPLVLEALDRRLDQPAAAPARGDDHRRTRGLLSLGRALEEGGDRAGAAATFRELAESGAPSRERVAAWLGLARLARAAAEVEGLRHNLQEAMAMARRLGPTAAGEAALETGLTFLSVRDANAWGFLEEAAANLSGGPGEALARLALLYRVGRPPAEEELGSHLQLLLQTEHAGQFAGNAAWLLPLLLETRASQKDGWAARALTRLARDFPLQLERSLRGGTLSATARGAAVEALAGSSTPSAGKLLEALAQDPDPNVAALAQKALKQQGGGEGLPVLRVHSLGALEVFKGEERVDEGDWKTKKVKYLFAYLMTRRVPVGEDMLIEIFWPEDAEKGRRNLYSATSALRKSLRPTTFPGELDYVLRVQAQLQINPSLPTWHDYEELERALSEAGRLRALGETQQGMQAARKVAALYRGPFLDGCYYDWALETRTRLEQQVSEHLFGLARWAAALGDERSRAEALEFARQVLEVDPCHQEAHLLTMQLFLETGRPQEAVRQFDACKRLLRQGLGMEPSIELMEAHQRALLSL